MKLNKVNKLLNYRVKLAASATMKRVASSLFILVLIAKIGQGWERRAQFALWGVLHDNQHATNWPIAISALPCVLKTKSPAIFFKSAGPFV